MIIKTPFSNLVLNWYHIFGRKNLPWKNKKNIYRIWISEVMLQQTPVKTVIPFYNSFINKFPDIKTLSNASLNEILYIWSGLGYYKRALYIYKTAQIIKKEKKYVFPNNFFEIIKLPGIGKTTAGAILSFSMGYFFSILDANIKRLLIRYYYIKPNVSKYNMEKKLWKIIEIITPIHHTDKFNQGILDIGSLLCKPQNPKCNLCPLNTYCLSYKKNIFFNIVHYKKYKYKNKKYWFLLIKYNHYILLEQRKLQNIWKNLFCFPAFSSQERILLWLKNNKKNYKNLIQIIHLKKFQISNFLLKIVIFVVIVENKIELRTKNKIIWFNLLKSKNVVGLPTFIKKIIKNLKYKK